MSNKFGSETRLPLTAAFSLSAVMAAVVAIAPSAQAQVACVASTNGTPSGTCAQYFAGGATFPIIVNRQFFDYYGIAISAPTTLFAVHGITSPNSTGNQPLNPAGSPRNINQQFNYCGTGSGNGRAIFTGVPATSTTSVTCSYANTAGIAPFPTNDAGVTPLFSGSSTPLSAANITDYTNTKLATRGNPIQFPTLLGAIGVGNNAALGNLSLTTDQLCGIFDGSVTSINGTAINVYIRRDNSGNTSTLTTYLAAICRTLPQYQAPNPAYYLSVGTNTFPTVPQTSTFTRVFNDSGVAGLIASNANGIGYIATDFGQPYSTTAVVVATAAITPAPLIASIQSPVSGSFIFPTPATINRGLNNLSLVANSTYPCVLTVAGVPTVTTFGNAYPIISPTYTLAYTRYPSTAEATAVRNVYNFVLGNRTVPFPAANDQIAGGLGFSVLSNNGAAVTLASGTVVTGAAAINALRGSARACIATITSP
jgi:phosphate transport system substrate-binding protein